MNTRTFLDHFGTIANAPAGVDRLRGLILQLAVRGRLVPQDADDDPAAQFIERLRLERLRRRDAGEGRGGLDVSDGLLADTPYNLPTGWLWTSFGAVSINRDAERVPLESGDRAVRRGAYDYYGASGAIDKIDDYLFDGELLLIGEDGANLALRNTPIAFIASGRFWVNNHAHVIDSISPESLRYLAICVNSIDLKPYLTGIAQPKLNQKRMNSLPVPVPPEAEQGRIVAKVDELMQICDELEAGQRARHGVSSRLRISCLDALTNAESEDGLQIAWVRIVTNWKAFTDQPDDIDAVRRTILRLAVRGRLARQDTREEDARRLLERISATGHAVLVGGLGKESKPWEERAASMPPFAMPPGWAWTSLGSVLSYCRNGISTPNNDDGRGFPLLRISAGTSRPDRLVDLEDCKFADLTDERAAPYLLDPGDLLACRFNGNLKYVGMVSQVPRTLNRSVLHPDKLIRMKAIEVRHDFLRIALNSDVVRAQIEGVASTTAGNIGINGAQLRSLLVPIPPLAEQDRIVIIFSELGRALDGLQRSLKERESVQASLAASATSSLAV